MKNISATFILCAILTLIACSTKMDNQITLSGLSSKDFQMEIDGKEVCVTNFGGRVVSIMVPDRNGVMQDVVLGFDNIKD